MGILYNATKNKVIKTHSLGLLLLGRNPQTEFENARIKFTIEQSVGDSKIKDIEGPVLLMPSRAEDLLDHTFLPEINRQNFHREEIIDIPKRLLRELILNAIVHRDYTIKDKQIRIVASKEKIEIWTPGEPIISIDKFRTYSVPSISRNPKLAYIFFKSGLVEERGIGMRELKAFKEENALPEPTFRMEEGYFVITVFRQRIKLDLSKEEQKGIDFVRKEKLVSKKQYAEYFKIDEKKAQRHLSKFKSLNLVTQEGKGKATMYRAN